MALNLSLEAFLAMADSDKAPLVGDRAVLFAQQYARHQIDRLGAIADAARRLMDQPAGGTYLAGLLAHRMALNFFVQPSSRTFLSFNAAQALLGMQRIDVRDAARSSMSKGESLVDTVHTFASYVDLIVMRHPDRDAAATAFWTTSHAGRAVRLYDGSEVPVPVISGGSGAEQHPTQALLDVYTLQRRLAAVGGLDGKTLLLVGDLARGRTVRSLALLAPQFPGLQLVLAAPARYQMRPDILAHLDEAGVLWRTADSLDEAIEEADAVYMTRIQDEHDRTRAPGTHEATDPSFRFTAAHLARMRAHAPLLHPLPKRDEIDPAVDLSGDGRVAYWAQERNGMWMRAALIAELFHVGDAILDAR